MTTPFRPSMEFDLRQLEVFAEIVRLGSFTKAAKSVHLSQATVSERVATLEEIVGAKLLNRQGGAITPTAAGELLYKHARELLRMRQQACLEIEDLLGLRKGDLRLGGSTIPGEYILPRVIGRFRQRCPGVSIRLAIAGSSEIARQVTEGELELGVIGTSVGPKSLTFHKLWSDELVLVVPASHRWAGGPPISRSELRQEPFVAREAGSGTRQTLERRLSLSLDELNVAVQVGTSTAVKEALKHGLGVSILSRRAVEDEVAAGRLVLVPFAESPIPREFHLIRDTRRAPSPICAAFTEFVLSEFAISE